MYCPCLYCSILQWILLYNSHVDKHLQVGLLVRPCSHAKSSRSKGQHLGWPALVAAQLLTTAGILLLQGEFETGFERGGQTREHAQLAKTLGVTKLIVGINKMDDPSIIEDSGQWSKARYDEIVSGLNPFLRQCGCALLLGDC